MDRFDTNTKTAPFGHIDVIGEPVVVQPPRLIVVMHETEEEALLAGRILALAHSRSLPIMLVGIAPHAADVARVRRKLATIGAFLKRGAAAQGMQQTAMQVEIQIEQGLDWVRRVKALLRPSDVLACYSDEVVGLRQRPLVDILSMNFNVPVYTFSGLHSAQPQRGSLSPVFAWVSSLALIGGFLVIQARIVTLSQGWAQTALLLITLFAEAGLIWFVNAALS